MSIPPTTVQIKRKRTDEPVEFLRIHEANGKRQRVLHGYVFERQPQPNPIALPSAEPTTSLGTRPIKPLHRTASSQALRRQATGDVHGQQNPRQQGEGSDRASQVGLRPDGAPTPAGNTRKTQDAQVRRFHMSRTISHEHGGSASRSKSSPIVFVERRVLAQKPPIAHTLPSDEGVAARPQKKPGRNARIPAPLSIKPAASASISDHSSAIPEAFKNRWNVPSDELQREMEAYALQEIGNRLAQQTPSQVSQESSVITHGQGHTKFKPNPSIKRYAERHPDTVTIGGDEMEIDYDEAEETINEEDYVTEIYIRVPTDTLETTITNAGLLVLDSQPDIDAFYGQDDDSDEDDEFDDEDENAENHYSADYPDEEVDSDDEYGRNVYNYRTHASDDEYDDAAYSDSDEDKRKHPWKNRANADPLFDVYA